jgi:hypothetical protein
MNFSLISTGVWSLAENATVETMKYAGDENRSSDANGSATTSKSTSNQQNNGGDGGVGDTAFNAISLAIGSSGVLANLFVIVIIVCFTPAKNKVIHNLVPVIKSFKASQLSAMTVNAIFDILGTCVMFSTTPFMVSTNQFLTLLAWLYFRSS